MLPVIVAGATSREFPALAAPIALWLVAAAGLRFATSMSIPSSVPTDPTIRRGLSPMIAAAVYGAILATIGGLLVLSQVIMNPPLEERELSLRPIEPQRRQPAYVPPPTDLPADLSAESLLVRLRAQGVQGTIEPVSAPPARWAVRTSDGVQLTYFDTQADGGDPWRMVPADRAQLFIRGPAGSTLESLIQRLTGVSAYTREGRMRSAMEGLRIRVSSVNSEGATGTLRRQSYVVRAVEDSTFGCTPTHSLTREGALLVITGRDECSPRNADPIFALARRVFGGQALGN